MTTYVITANYGNGPLEKSFNFVLKYRVSENEEFLIIDTPETTVFLNLKEARYVTIYEVSDADY